jgi:hypothetical protein
MSAQTQIPPQEIVARGRALYEQNIRHQVDTPQNHGQFISLDILSGDYEIGTSHIQTTLRLRERHPDPAITTLRIGYRATFTRNGRMTPEK